MTWHWICPTVGAFDVSRDQDTIQFTMYYNKHDNVASAGRYKLDAWLMTSTGEAISSSYKRTSAKHNSSL